MPRKNHKKKDQTLQKKAATKASHKVGKKPAARRSWRPPLIPTNSVEKIVIAITTSTNTTSTKIAELVQEEVRKTTGTVCVVAEVKTTTPKGRHIETATTPGGTTLVDYSPFKNMEFAMYSEDGEVAFTLNINFLIRVSDKEERKPSAILEALDKSDRGTPVTQSATSTYETRKSQVPRKLIKSQNSVLGCSAKDALVAHLAGKLDIPIVEVVEEIKKLNPNWCHLLSVAGSNKGVDEIGKVFDTQKPGNIFAGSRKLNTSAFPLENSQIRMLSANEVASVEGEAICIPYKEVHAAAEIRLKAHAVKHDKESFAYQKELDPRETREVLREVTTLVDGIMKVFIKRRSAELNGMLQNGSPKKKQSAQKPSEEAVKIDDDVHATPTRRKLFRSLTPNRETSQENRSAGVKSLKRERDDESKEVGWSAGTPRFFGSPGPSVEACVATTPTKLIFSYN